MLEWFSAQALQPFAQRGNLRPGFDQAQFLVAALAAQPAHVGGKTLQAPAKPDRA
jgi:hypothetical protein